MVSEVVFFIKIKGDKMFEQIIIVILSALVGGLIGSYVSGYGQRRKSLWDLRFSAYQELIESLDGMVGSFSLTANYIDGQLGHTDKVAKPSQEKINAESKVLHKMIVYGHLLYSKEVEEKLNQLSQDIHSFDYDNFDPEDYYSFNTLCSSRAGECLNFVVKQSKSDLDLSPTIKSVFSKFFDFLKI